MTACSWQALARQFWDEAGRLAKAYAAQQLRKAWAATKRLVKKVVKAVARAAVSTAHWAAKHSEVITQVGLAVAAVALTVVNVAQLGLDPVTDAAEAADVGALATDVAATTAAEAGEGAAEEATSEADNVVYRGDSRSPEEIERAGGFQPRAPGSNTSLYDYAANNTPSNYVLTPSRRVSRDVSLALAVTCIR